jgi:hypothetical protein
VPMRVRRFACTSHYTVIMLRTTRGIVRPMSDTGTPIDINDVFNAYRQTVADLTDSNITLKAINVKLTREIEQLRSLKDSNTGGEILDGGNG